MRTITLIIYLCHLTGLKSACLQILQPFIFSFLIRTNFTRSFLARKLSATIHQSDTIQGDWLGVYRLCNINCRFHITARFSLIMWLSSFLNTLLASCEKKKEALEKAKLLLNTLRWSCYPVFGSTTPLPPWKQNRSFSVKARCLRFWCCTASSSERPISIRIKTWPRIPIRHILVMQIYLV